MTGWINLADLHDRLGEAAARQLYEERGRWAFHPIGFMRRLMTKLKPDVVVATNSPRSEAAARSASGQAIEAPADLRPERCE